VLGCHCLAAWLVGPLLPPALPGVFLISVTTVN